MSEQQEDYITDANEMLGAGYEQPAAVIDPQRTVKALSDKGLIEYQAWGWVKLSAKFIWHILRLKGSKLSTWQVIALSIDADGKCGLSVPQIATLSGYSAVETRRAIKELDEMGYLSVNRSNGKKNIYSPEFTARSGKTPTEKTSKDTPIEKDTPIFLKDKRANDPYLPPIENPAPTSKELKRVNSATALSQDEINQVNKKVDYILANNDSSKAWQGREMIRADLLELADWYNLTTGQVMSKRSQSSWWKALGQWKEEGLTIQDLQTAYDARSKWRTVSDPNELTKDAAAIHALPKAQEVYDPNRPKSFGL